MTELALLNWARGPGLQIATVVFLAGIVLRLLEIYGLGRKPDISPTRAGQGGVGWRTMFTRSWPRQAFFKRGRLTYVMGYIFHLGLFITLVFFVPHIELFASVWGLRWPGLPTAVIDAVALASMVALAVLLWHRVWQPVKRFLSVTGDYVAWALTFAPLATGYLAFHHMLLPYTTMLAVHILSVELLMVALPFTKLAHAFTVFVSRWYNGEMLGHKGAGL